MCIDLSAHSLREHPRVCGENRPEHMATVTSEGTSPRMRGKHWEDGLDNWKRLEHPRVCGENQLVRIFFLFSLGTSPRARGKLAWSSRVRAGFRNIPACAGKTDAWLRGW